jgi:hypothetical protein
MKLFRNVGLVQSIPLARVMEGRARQGKRVHTPSFRHQETLIYHDHAGESSIEELTRQASRQKEIQQKSDEKTEEEKGRKKVEG